MEAPVSEQEMVAVPSALKVMTGVGTVTLPKLSETTLETLSGQLTATVTALKVVLGVCHSKAAQGLVMSVPLLAVGSLPSTV